MIIDIFQQMQQEQSQPDQDWLVQLDLFAGFIKESVDFLDSYSSRVSERMVTYRYPLSGYIKAWKQLLQKTNFAIKKFKQTRFQVLLSTIINWVMTAVVTGYNDVFVFIKQCTNQSRMRNQDNQLSMSDCKELNELFKLETSFKLKVLSTETILQVPFVFMQRLKERIITFSEALQLRQAFLLSSSNNIPSESVGPIAQKLQIIKIQTNELKNSLLLLTRHIEFLNKSDENGKLINRDNSVLIFNIINKQYPQLPKSKFLMKYVFRLKLICRWKKIDKKRIQRVKDRKMKILQLIDGEVRYIKGLDQYITLIKNPILDLKILDVEHQRLLFSSIDSIRDFHKSMYKDLQAQFDNYNEKQEYGKILSKFIPFFKLYTDYILNATVAQKYMQDLTKSSKEVGQVCRKYTETTSKVAHNELSQPTFRVARYQALFEGIIKNTSKSHPDYKLLQTALSNFNKILMQVNNEVDKIIRRNRLNQLEIDYGTPEQPIYQQGRQFITQYPLTLIKEPKPEQVNLIICNNLLLLLDDDSKKVMKKILVDKNFFARREEDNKIYRNMITIHSDGLMTFTVGSEEVNANRAEEVYQVLKKITKDTGEQAIVQVIGTEEIGSTSFAKYTEYIIEVRLRDMKKLLHMRFSSIIDMVAAMQCHYKNDLKITQDQNMKKTWLSTHSSKIIEARKITIAQIFMKMFNHELIIKEPEYFLKYLNLPTNFYQMAESAYQKRISMGQSVTVSGLRRAYLTKKQERQMFTLLCGTEIELGRDLFHDSENSDQLKKAKQTAQKIQVKILTLIEEEPVVVKISKFDTVQDVCNKVSTLIGLRSNRDFRLFHQIGKKQLRVLDHEQILTEIFTFPCQKKDIIVGFVENIKSAFNKIISPETQPTLIFKKYYYLPSQLEQVEVRKDLTRLRLIVYQIFSQICDMKYQLNFDEYLLFLSMLIYITIEGKIQNIGEIDPSIVHRIIPSTVFKLKNYSEKQWLAKCNHHLNRLHQEIQKVIEFNRAQLKTNKIKADTVSKMSLYFGHKHLCSQIVLNKIKSNSIFGSNLFYVQPHSTCYKKLEQEGLKVAYNMWLAIKMQSMDLLTPSSKEFIMQLKYSQIQKVTVFSQSIVIRKAGAIEVDYRLNTYQSFQISQLIKYNKALNSTIAKIKDDSSLNARVKQYRDQLMQYRATYEGADESYSLIK